MVHSTAARNASVDAILALINAGTPPGKLKFRVGGTIGAGGAVAATLTFSNTAFGASSGGVATAAAITADASAAGNASAVTKASIENAAGTIIIYCDVGTSGSEINLSGTTITAGDSVAISALTYTAQA